MTETVAHSTLGDGEVESGSAVEPAWGLRASAPASLTAEVIVTDYYGRDFCFREAKLRAIGRSLVLIHAEVKNFEDVVSQ